MSAFLGPVHYWLYHKIQMQEELTARFADMALQNGWIETDSYSHCDTHSLESIIDESNIHGWLQEHIHSAEHRFAELITEILRSHTGRMEQLQETAFTFGQKLSDTALKEPSEAYKLFNDSFVNGMPCDGVNHIISEEKDCLSWEESVDMHSGYWQDGNAAPYYTIRLSVMKGMLDGINLDVEEYEPKKFHILRR